jgi:hypothetical protein
MKTWVENYIQGPPERLSVERVPVDAGPCPQCGSEDIRRYPIGCVWGARMVTKCQACLHTLEIERPQRADSWPPFRSLTYEWEPAPSERASRGAREQDKQR